MNDTPFQDEKSAFLHHCFFLFHVVNQEHFSLFSQVYAILREEKQKRLKRFQSDSDDESDDEIERQVKEERQEREKVAENIFILLDDRIVSHFWWPSQQELKDYSEQWRATPIEQRLTDPFFQTPWGFSSLIESILTGEYAFVSCQLVAPDQGMLVFGIFSFPYGSSDAIKALISAFDFEMIGADVGTGYQTCT